MFEKSLTDLVKGIRNAKGDPTPFITKCISEVKEELKSRDVTIKAGALQKMTYVGGGSGCVRGVWVCEARGAGGEAKTVARV